jgi:hypothetical protein
MVNPTAAVPLAQRANGLSTRVLNEGGMTGADREEARFYRIDRSSASLRHAPGAAFAAERAARAVAAGRQPAPARAVSH